MRKPRNLSPKYYQKFGRVPEMGKALDRVVRVINQSDVVVEVLDARFPHKSARLKKIVGRKGKEHIYILNKIDLIGTKEGENLAREIGALPFSAKTRYGKRKLLARLEELAGGPIKVGILGTPNVGKSSIINVLRGRKSAPTSSTPGYTKGEQWIKITPNVLLIDSPGVITWDAEEDDLILQDSLDIDKAEDPISTALKLFDRNPEVLKKLGLTGTGEEALSEFALKTGKLKKGGVPNKTEAAKMIVRRWQRGTL